MIEQLMTKTAEMRQRWKKQRRNNALKLCRKAVQKAFIGTSCGRVSFLLAGSFHRACIMRNYAVRQLSYVKPRQAKSIPANPDQARPSQAKPDQFQIKIRQTNLSQLTNQSLKTMQTKPRESNASQPSHVNPFKVRRENPTVAPIQNLKFSNKTWHFLLKTIVSLKISFRF